MTDKASPKGWIVRVTTKRLGRPPSVAIYDAAIPDLPTRWRLFAGLAELVLTPLLRQ